MRDFSREDQIRTGDPLHPMQVRYRAAPLPELSLLPIKKNQFLRPSRSIGMRYRPAPLPAVNGSQS